MSKKFILHYPKKQICRTISEPMMKFCGKATETIEVNGYAFIAFLQFIIGDNGNESINLCQQKLGGFHVKILSYFPHPPKWKAILFYRHSLLPSIS